MTDRDWTLRYAPHLGVLTPDVPLFPHLAGSADPVAQVHFIADRGLHGIGDNFFKSRPVETQRAIAAAVERRGLSMGCIVNNSDTWQKPLLNSADPDARDFCAAELRETIEAAARIGASVLTTVVARARDQTRDAQMATLLTTLRHLAPIAERAGVVIGLEAVNRVDCPMLLLEDAEEACAIAERVGSPAVRVVFDFYHTIRAGHDPLASFDRCKHMAAAIQVADAPNRTEMGSGVADWPLILQAVHDSGHHGLIELEHMVTQADAKGEAAVLANLSLIDARILPRSRLKGACG